MNKLSLILAISSISIPALSAQMPVANQTPFISTWLILLFLALGLIMFFIFWLMKNQSSKPSLLDDAQIPPKPQSNEVMRNLQNLPKPKVPNQFYEVSSENKPLPDDRAILATMQSKIQEVKVHGIPKKSEPDPKIKEAVDEILEQEFKKRAPEFRGEKVEYMVLPSPPPIENLPQTPTRQVSHKAPKSKPMTNLPLNHKMPKIRDSASPGKAAKKSKKKKAKSKTQNKKSKKKVAHSKKKTSISKKSKPKKKISTSKKQKVKSNLKKSKPKLSKKKIKSKPKKKR